MISSSMLSRPDSVAFTSKGLKRPGSGGRIHREVGHALNGDFPVVLGATLFASLVFIVSTLGVDVINRLRDPAAATTVH
jgi:hypothetical protein